MGSQAVPQSPAIQAMQERLKARLLQLRALLDGQSSPQATALCIREIDRIELQILELAGSCRAHEDELPVQGCDPWISVSF